MASFDDPSTWMKWSTADEELVNMVQQGIKPRFIRKDNDFPAIRSVWNPLEKSNADEALAAVADEIHYEELSIPLRDGSSCRTLLYKPKKPSSDGGGPLLVLLHGGGFCLGTPEMESVNCINAARAHGCVALSVDYRLAPEYKFPVAYNDSWDVLKWVAANTKELGADPSKGFILGGCSAGGLMTVALTHIAVDEKLSPQLTGVYLNVAGCVAPGNMPERYAPLSHSREPHENRQIFSYKSTTDYEGNFTPDWGSPLWNPLNWPTGHQNHPPAYMQICGLDTLRDEMLIYDRVLRLEHGVKTKIDIYSGVPHVFWMTYPDHSMAKKYVEDTVHGLGWLLSNHEA